MAQSRAVISMEGRGQREIYEELCDNENMDELGTNTVTNQTPLEDQLAVDGISPVVKCWAINNDSGPVGYWENLLVDHSILEALKLEGLEQPQMEVVTFDDVCLQTFQALGVNLPSVLASVSKEHVSDGDHLKELLNRIIPTGRCSENFSNTNTLLNSEFKKGHAEDVDATVVCGNRTSTVVGLPITGTPESHMEDLALGITTPFLGVTSPVLGVTSPVLGITSPVLGITSPVLGITSPMLPNAVTLHAFSQLIVCQSRYHETAAAHFYDHPEVKRARASEEFRLFQQRFLALFTAPALMATTNVQAFERSKSIQQSARCKVAGFGNISDSIDGETCADGSELQDWVKSLHSWRAHVQKKETLNVPLNAINFLGKESPPAPKRRTLRARRTTTLRVPTNSRKRMRMTQRSAELSPRQQSLGGLPVPRNTIMAMFAAPYGSVASPDGSLQEILGKPNRASMLSAARSGSVSVSPTLSVQDNMFTDSADLSAGSPNQLGGIPSSLRPCSTTPGPNCQMSISNDESNLQFALDRPLYIDISENISNNYGSDTSSPMQRVKVPAASVQNDARPPDNAECHQPISDQLSVYDDKLDQSGDGVLHPFDWSAQPGLTSGSRLAAGQRSSNCSSSNWSSVEYNPVTSDPASANQVRARVGPCSSSFGTRPLVQGARVGPSVGLVTNWITREPWKPWARIPRPNGVTRRDRKKVQNKDAAMRYRVKLKRERAALDKELAIWEEILRDRSSLLKDARARGTYLSQAINLVNMYSPAEAGCEIYPATHEDRRTGWTRQTDVMAKDHDAPSVTSQNPIYPGLIPAAYEREHKTSSLLIGGGVQQLGQENGSPHPRANLIQSHKTRYQTPSQNGTIEDWNLICSLLGQNPFPSIPTTADGNPITVGIIPSMSEFNPPTGITNSAITSTNPPIVGKVGRSRSVDTSQHLAQMAEGLSSTTGRPSSGPSPPNYLEIAREIKKKVSNKRAAERYRAKLQQRETQTNRDIYIYEESLKSLEFRLEQAEKHGAFLTKEIRTLGGVLPVDEGVVSGDLGPVCMTTRPELGLSLHDLERVSHVDSESNGHNGRDTICNDRASTGQINTGSDGGVIRGNTEQVICSFTSSACSPSYWHGQEFFDSDDNMEEGSDVQQNSSKLESGRNKEQRLVRKQPSSQFDLQERPDCGGKLRNVTEPSGCLVSDVDNLKLEPFDQHSELYGIPPVSNKTHSLVPGSSQLVQTQRDQISNPPDSLPASTGVISSQTNREVRLEPSLPAGPLSGPSQLGFQIPTAITPRIRHPRTKPQIGLTAEQKYSRNKERNKLASQRHRDKNRKEQEEWDTMLAGWEHKYRQLKAQAAEAESYGSRLKHEIDELESSRKCFGELSRMDT